MVWTLRALSTAYNRQSAYFLRQQSRSSHSTGLLDELTARGFVQDVTRRDELAKLLATKPQGVYAGVDPTASSLHVGHLVPLLCLVHFHLHGHKVVPLIGSATGRIGDPSGRNTERKQQQTEELDANISGLTQSMTNFFKRAFIHASQRLQQQDTVQPDLAIRPNHVWHEKLSMLDFLQVIGVHTRVNAMMNRESVRARLASQQGISFTEFTYQLLQAYDFYHLNKHEGCNIQVGGSDQWGNIVAGIELIGKLSSTEAPASNAYGITTPLLTTPSGEKFGKSAGNAVWLDESLTSVFDFYQYFFKTPDSVLSQYLKLFTFIPRTRIDEIVEEHGRQPELRAGQKVLAAEVTEMVHGTQALEKAKTITTILFPTSASNSSETLANNYSNLTRAQIIAAFESSDPRLVYIPAAELADSTPVVKLAKKAGLVASNSVAKSLVASRGLYLNNVVVPDIQATVSRSQLIDGSVAILRAGKDKLVVLIAQ